MLPLGRDRPQPKDCRPVRIARRADPPSHWEEGTPSYGWFPLFLIETDIAHSVKFGRPSSLQNCHDIVWHLVLSLRSELFRLMTSTTRSEKLDLRLTPGAKRTLQAAAAAQSRSVSSYSKALLRRPHRHSPTGSTSVSTPSGGQLLSQPSMRRHVHCHVWPSCSVNPAPSTPASDDSRPLDREGRAQASS